MDRAPRSRPAGRLLVLLVMAVLTGVLGMHALPPGGAPAAHTTVMAHEAQPAHGATVQCAHGGHGPDHLQHADGTCAAAGIGAPYAPPALDAAVLDAPAVPVHPAGVFAAAERGRAPPDLSELQLLRI